MGEQERPRLAAQPVERACRAPTPGRGRRSAAADLVGADHPVAAQVHGVDHADHRRITVPSPRYAPYLGPGHRLEFLRMSEHRLPEPDRPWVMRTYAGHSDARRSNELYRRNLAKGQTGLSVAFDLPTQTGYDPDHIARPRRGRQGRRLDRPQGRHARALRRHPARRDEHLDDDQRHRRLAARPLRRRSPRRTGSSAPTLKGTTQNDIIKEYLSRGTYAFPPGPSMRLIADTVAFTVNEIPSWNPINVCSYHLQEAGATPVQEIAYALSTAIAVLDEVKAPRPGRRGGLPARSSAGSRSSSTPASASSRSTRSCARWASMWEEIGRKRYGVTEPKFLRLRYGVQVNSLGLTESQPENNVPADRARGARGDARAATPAPARSSSRPGTRRSASRGPGTSSGACGSSRSSPTRPTCSTTPTSSRARR